MTRLDFLWAAFEFSRLPEAERAVINLEMDRLKKGYREYGPLMARLRELDLQKEGVEEIADRQLYRSMAEYLEREDSVI